MIRRPGLAAFVAVLCGLTTFAHGRVETVVETFNGDGEFSSTDGMFTGLDNPGWTIKGDGVLENGGYSFENSFGNVRNELEILQREIVGTGSFVSRVEILGLDLGNIGSDSSPDSRGFVSILHRLGGDPTNGFLSVSLNEPDDDDTSLWQVNFFAGDSEMGVHAFVPRGSNVALELVYDDRQSVATILYDDDTSDAAVAYEVELDYDGKVARSHLFTIRLAATDDGSAKGILDHWSIFPAQTVSGDFNANGIFDAEDIDLLNAEIRSGSNNPDFDLVEDGVVDALDRTFWVHTINHTYFGDANLDGEFNSGDLVAVFQAGHYEDDSMAGWAAGDWNGDARFTSNDLVVAFQDGGYETGPRAAANAVPEPTSASWLLLFSWLLASRRQVRVRFGNSC